MPKKDIVNKIYSDLKYSAEKMSKIHKQIKEDFKFAQGDQWDSEDVRKLEAAGVKALTINKIKPIIKLITGIERQSRSDMKAFPEGGEDAISADIASRLIKNVSKNSRVEIKQSEVFKNGCTGGMCFLEPYMDYSFDLINGDLKWKKVSSLQVYLDPDFQEYDLSDSRFIIKITSDLSEDDLISLFPDKEKEIKRIENGKVNIDGLIETEHYQELDYTFGKNSVIEEKDVSEPTYDLIDYYYKELQTRYYVIVQERGIIQQFDAQEEAESFAEQVNGQVFDRKVPVVMLAQAVGRTELYHDISWTYPKWKTYPIIPFFAELITEELDDFSLKIQGIVRTIKDLNLEYNKRRTQELRHLNSSANSGFDIEKGQLDDSELHKLKKYGSSPGIVIERKKGTPPITRITPAPLSQGHAQLAVENAQDLKEASGVNPDLLANDSQSQSGRAILLKQRQGLVMIQEILDNFSETKRLIGRFILSQLSELFTVESAIRVLGDAFLADNFTVPVNMVLERALQKVENDEQPTQLEESVLLQYPENQSDQPIVDDNNNLVTMVDLDTAMITINKVLTDADLNKYDVAIGEGPYQETIRMANFMDLKELAQQGVPIPPQLLLESSMLPDSEKNKAIKLLAQQAQMSQTQSAQS